jgi:hypothetical protein
MFTERVTEQTIDRVSSIDGVNDLLNGQPMIDATDCVNVEIETDRQVCGSLVVSRIVQGVGAGSELRRFDESAQFFCGAIFSAGLGGARATAPSGGHGG